MTRRRLLGAALGAGLSPSLLRGEEPDADQLPPEAQRAVERGLTYLARAQNADGSFGERPPYAGNVAVTSLAALALMAAGHQPGRGPLGAVVLRAVQFVLGRESRETPGFLHNGSVAGQGPMYSHGFGALLLAEAHGTMPDAALARQTRECLERAVRLIAASQNKEGGWRYHPVPTAADLSVTICQIMALRAARNAGLAVPRSCVDACTRYVRSCQLGDGGFSYMPNSGGSQFARSAAGVVALYCAGVYKGPELDRGLKYLLRHKPGTAPARRDMHYFYGQYYAAQAMWTAGGAYWAEWFPAIRDELLERPYYRGDAWTDPVIGHHYATAMALIILQIPNNYLPILQK